MDLRPNAGSDRAWVWNTLADYADECPKAESLAIRFLNAESKYPFWGSAQHPFQFACAAGIMSLMTLLSFVFLKDAQKFKVKFEECREEVKKIQQKKGG